MAKETNHLRVKLPAGKITGRSLSTSLRSLEQQIKAEHMNRIVKDFYISREDREIGVVFQEGRPDAK